MGTRGGMQVEKHNQIRQESGTIRKAEDWGGSDLAFQECYTKNNLMELRVQWPGLKPDPTIKQSWLWAIHSTFRFSF